ncbi:unnamed protein product [Parascedosporium putredinis]|uniref:N-acetyltransferase domain-containing protein n=1 Tax=Parascedosporium putredinis TaxID=1442378 RepID=A0A9P1MDL5_9PEZI|nr:unnamed protein product [Parascedosporium putredinis]CAI8000842.1 unnamed protein product [Parascedosporium putredinis]
MSLHPFCHDAIFRGGSPLPEVSKIRVNCEYRPATLDDMEAVTAVYNAEVQSEGMVADGTEVPVSKFVTIFEECLAEDRPFLVAVHKAKLLNKASWPDEEAFSEYMHWRQETGGLGSGAETIVAFSYLCLFDPSGALGGGKSSFAARIELVVHPHKRRRGFGSGLMDLMLQMTVKDYRPQLEYVWDCPNPGKVYNLYAEDNGKRYRMVLVQTFLKHMSRDALMKRRLFIERIFQFTNMAHIPGAYRSSRTGLPGDGLEGEGEEWQDKAIWGKFCQFSNAEIFGEETRGPDEASI